MGSKSRRFLISLLFFRKVWKNKNPGMTLGFCGVGRDPCLHEAVRQGTADTSPPG